MAELVPMIALSPTMSDGVIAQWFAREGQDVRRGDALCEVETDKATMAYESPSSGTLLKILVPGGGAAGVGQAIAVMGKPGEDWSPLLEAKGGKPGPTADPASAEPSPKNTAAFPALGPTPPALPGTASGGDVPGASPESPDPRAAPRPGRIPSSPLARRMAAERGVDLSAVSGSGPRGRIVAADVLVAANAAQGSRSPTPGEAPSASVATGARPAAGLRSDRVGLSRMRAVIADRLGRSWSEAPHYFVRVAVDMERLLDLRSALNAGRKRPYSLNAFFAKLAASALTRHPMINASWEGDAIRYLPDADIGLAVALDAGLVTPVLRACQDRGIEDLDRELAELVARARAGALKPEEYSGASFTISNLGSFGVEEFTAIVNPPGSAILALGAVAKEAAVRDDGIAIRRVMRATLSCDHRVIDGAQAAAFLADFKAMLEEPGLALM